MNRVITMRYAIYHRGTENTEREEKEGRDGTFLYYGTEAFHRVPNPALLLLRVLRAAVVHPSPFPRIQA